MRVVVAFLCAAGCLFGSVYLESLLLFLAAMCLVLYGLSWAVTGTGFGLLLVALFLLWLTI